MTEKECEICGGYFTPSRSNQIYCPECGKDSYRLKQKMQANLERIGRQYYDLLAPKYKHICKQCGEEFESHSETQDFCSGRCVSANRIKNAVCEYCGRNMLSLGIRINKDQTRGIYCSDECREKHKWQTARERGAIGKCPECGKEFIIPKSGKTYCSRECYMKFYKREKPVYKPTRICVVCKKEYKAGEGFDTEVCSDKCRNILDRYRDKRRIHERKEYEKQLAKERKAKTKAKEEQYIKENGLCSICKTSYVDCERMQTNFRLSPKGAKFDGSLVISCPKFKGAKLKKGANK